MKFQIQNLLTRLGGLSRATFVVLALIAMAGRAHANTITWINPTVGIWSNPSNWNPANVPGPTDTAVITNTGSVVYLQGSVEVSNIVLGAVDACINGSGVTLNINSQTIYLYGQITVNPCSTFVFDSGTIYGSSTNSPYATLSGDVTLSGSGQILGIINVGTNSVFSITTGVNQNWPNFILNNYGIVEWSNGTIQGGGSSGTVINNYGVWDEESDLDLNNAYGQAGTTFNNQGTFIKSGSTGGNSTIDTGVVFNNAGILDSRTNSIVLSGTGNFTGGYVTTNLTGLTVFSSGTVNINGTVTSTNVQLAGATLTGTNVINGALNWIVGDWSSGAQVTIATNSTLLVTGANDHNLANCTLTNNGTLAWSGGTIQGGGSSGTFIYNYGLWDAQSDQTLNNAYGLAGTAFNNYGTFRKSGGAGQFSNYTLFTSGTVFNQIAGVIDVQSGTNGLDLFFQGVGNFTGGYVTTNLNGLTVFSIGTFNINGTVTGMNTWQDGGNLTGTNVINGALTWAAGNWNGAPYVTIATNSTLIITNTGDLAIVNCTITNNGAVQWNSGTLQGGGSTGTFIYNYGLWDAQSDYAINSDFGQNGTVFNNLGTFRKSGGSTGTTFRPSDNSTTIFNNQGTVLNFSGGPITLDGGGVFSAGSISNLVVLGGGAFNINGTVTSTNLQENGANLSGNNVLYGGFTWVGGNWNSGAQVTIATNSTLVMAGAGDLGMGNCTLINNGTVAWSGGTIQGGGSSGTLIYNYGLWEVLCDYALNSDFGQNGIGFYNAGKFRKLNTTGTTSWTPTTGAAPALFVNIGGSIELDSGTLSIAGNFTIPSSGLTIGVGGKNSGQYGSLIVGGNAILGGPLKVFLTNNFQPYIPERFTIVSSSSDSGAFSSISLPAGLQINYTNSDVYLNATNVLVPPGPITSQLSGANLLFSFPTSTNQSYTIETITNLASTNWEVYMSVSGSGTTQQFSIPITNTVPQLFLRLSEP
jgi:hypothetical protein